VDAGGWNNRTTVEDMDLSLRWGGTSAYEVYEVKKWFQAFAFKFNVYRYAARVLARVEVHLPGPRDVHERNPRGGGCGTAVESHWPWSLKAPGFNSTLEPMK
jgi:hypothetical protein